MAKTSTVDAAIPRVNRSTRPSTERISNPVTRPGARWERNWNVVIARKIPRKLPARQSRRLSHRNWRTSRHPPAPSAMRTATSFPLLDALESNRFARFEQAIKRTKPTVPSKTTSMLRLERTKWSRMGATKAPTRSPHCAPPIHAHRHQRIPP
jgi:hypothetical protein